MSYAIAFTVLADSRLEAITKAIELLRSNVKCNGVLSAEQGVPGWWDVSLHVWEDV